MDCFITQDMESKIFKYLSDIGCCYSCCLRHIGTRSSEYFFDPIETSTKLKYISQADELINEGRCISCLGILCVDIEKEAVQKIKTAIKNGGYDSSNFTCALSLPVSLKIREMSIHIAIGEKFNLTENQLISLKLKTWNVKDVWKAQVVPLIENECSMKFVSAPIPSLFSIDISFINDEDEKNYCNLLKECDLSLSTAGNKNQRNKIYSRNNIDKFLLTINKKNFVEYFSVPADRPIKIVKIEKVGCSHGSVFIGGRYTKLNRQLSQTPWFVNGEKKMETSVQDLLCGLIVEHTKAESLKFLSSGREDVDVRTINSGRPFAVELANPRITKISDEEFQTIVTKINASTTLVQITSSLKILNNADLKKLKEGENQKTKFYRALCTVRSKNIDTLNLAVLESIKNLKIVQKTPVRVLHRRPLASRPRIIHSMRGRLLTQEEMEKLSNRAPKSLLENLFVLDIKTQAGTYIKEFVHGDFGRTNPNLSDLLGQRIDIAALDVTRVNLDWP